MHKTPLTADPGQARAQLAQLGATLTQAQNAAGERLRAVAVELVRRGLQVTVVDYQDAWELEVIAPQARHLAPVTIDLDASGTGCTLAWEHWADITDQAGATRAADMTAALLYLIAPAGHR
jgi:hypothetical protein